MRKAIHGAVAGPATRRAETGSSTPTAEPARLDCAVAAAGNLRHGSGPRAAAEPGASAQAERCADAIAARAGSHAARNASATR